DRVHAAMLFQASGASNALRALLETEIGRGPEFLRLANALTALYPKDSEEKRLLDALLLAGPRQAYGREEARDPLDAQGERADDRGLCEGCRRVKPLCAYPRLTPDNAGAAFDHAAFRARLCGRQGA